MKSKQRLSASVDADLLRAAEQAVASGRAATVSAWINEALRAKVEHDRRLDAMAAFVAAYEAEHGVITDEEMRQARRSVMARAVSSRDLMTPKRPQARRARR